MVHVLPAHRRSQRIILLLAAAAMTATALSACGPSNTSAHDGPTGTPAPTAAPRGAVTRAEADQFLDH